MVYPYTEDDVELLKDSVDSRLLGEGRPFGPRLIVLFALKRGDAREAVLETVLVI